MNDKTRQRRTKAQVAQLDRQIIEVLTADHPQSVRHVFYQLTDPTLPEPIEKSDRGYRAIQYRIAEMRRAGTLPYSWISDASRRGYFVSTYANKADFLRRMAGVYRADLWSLSDHYVEVWAESRSIASVIQDDCEELAVSLYPAAGFASLTLTYEAAQEINAAAAGKFHGATIYYIGDYDPAGVLIDRDIERKLREHLDPDIRLHFVRLGITASQVRLLNLPTKPRKATDRRAPHVGYTVEAEAMRASLLRALLRDSIEQHLPKGALESAKVAEQSEREGLLRIAAAMELVE